MIKEQLIYDWRIVQRDTDYEVNEIGVIRRRTPGRGTRVEQTLKHHIEKNGYRSMTIKAPNGRTRVPVHVIVCEAFHGQKPGHKYEVRHLDGNKLNNHRDNLCWGTRAENVADTIKHTGGYNRGSNNSKAKFTKQEVIRLRNLYDQSLEQGTYYKGWIGRLAGSEGVDNTTLSGMLMRRTYRYE